MRNPTDELATMTTDQLIAHGRRVGAKAFTIDRKAMMRTLAAQATARRAAA
jgi:hypothetical protein